MPQEFQVLRCHACSIFQVHQVKKTTKWSCKMCGQKQSVIKVFGRGSGADCRAHVQKCNLTYGEMREAQEDEESSIIHSADNDTRYSQQENKSMVEAPQPRKWERFLEVEAPPIDEGENYGYDPSVGAAEFTTSRVEFDQTRKAVKKERQQRFRERRSAAQPLKKRWTESNSEDWQASHGHSSNSRNHLQNVPSFSNSQNASQISKTEMGVGGYDSVERSDNAISEEAQEHSDGGESRVNSWRNRSGLEKEEQKKEIIHKTVKKTSHACAKPGSKWSKFLTQTAEGDEEENNDDEDDDDDDMYRSQHDIVLSSMVHNYTRNEQIQKNDLSDDDMYRSQHDIVLSSMVHNYTRNEQIQKNDLSDRQSSGFIGRSFPSQDFKTGKVRVGSISSVEENVEYTRNIENTGKSTQYVSTIKKPTVPNFSVGGEEGLDELLEDW